MVQRELFSEQIPPSQSATGLFADIVFDRPLDHAYSYAVPRQMAKTLTVGKRVQAPFGRGDKLTVGYCVRISTTRPNRTVKEVSRVLDEEALLTADLLRLTRWMADYYLCGWGQVLNAVVPSGAKRGAGTRTVPFLEALPEKDWPTPMPALTAKQKTALEELLSAEKPLEPRHLARLARCGPAPVEALVEKGFARRVLQTVSTFDPVASRDQ